MDKMTIARPMPWVAQVTAPDALPLDRSPFVGVYEIMSGNRRIFLYILVESNHRKADEVCQRVQHLLEQQIRSSSLSITSSLNNAIKMAHHQFLEENRRSLPAHHVGARVTCAVLKGNDLFIAQAGTGLAYILGQAGLRRMANFVGAESDVIDALGRDVSLEVALYHHPVEEGDVILLASPRLQEYLTSDDVVTLLRAERDQSAKWLEQIPAPGERFTALMIRPSDMEQQDDDPIWNDRPTIGESPEPRAAIGEVDRMEKWKALFLVLGQGLLHSLKRLVSLAARLFQALRGSLTPAVDDPDEFARPKREKDSPPPEPVIFPTAHRFPAVSTKQPSYRRSRMPIIAVAGVILVAVLLVIGLYLPSRPAEAPKDDGFAQVLRQAQDIKQQAQGSSRVSSRDYLQNANKLVDRALQIRKDEPQAKELKQQITGQLATVNAVVSLDDLRQLVDFSGQEKGAENPSTVLVGSGQLYVLDKGADRVTRHAIDSNGIPAAKVDPVVLWRRGEQWGSVTLNKLADLVWLPAGGSRQSEAALLFDDKRNLLEQVPGKGAAPLVVRDVEKLNSLDAVAGFNGSLYLLDRRGNQVWRYDPTFNGFDSERRAMIEIADLKDAVDLGIDGSIFVLTGDGKVLKFASGLQLSFNQDEIDKPMQAPTALFVNSQTKYVYVADPANQRVVVFGKDGKFHRQFVNEKFSGLRGLFVDEEKRRIYLVSDKKLYLATLPKEPPAPTPTVKPSGKQ